MFRRCGVPAGGEPQPPIIIQLFTSEEASANQLHIHLFLFCYSKNMTSDSEEPSFVSLILRPGSSLHPTFLFAVDAAFALLFIVFLWSAYLTKGNPHFFVLMGIQLALWASVKWFVQELKKVPPVNVTTSMEKNTDKKEQ
ncbi:hypothetical protein BDR07DRAFT_1387532 [Suillus spraguei]|nr:hypothetical protein BDR07DRAFT_1387532 [Suillus spraguei]